jgi:mono/diheme cytochrome c family protein
MSTRSRMATVAATAAALLALAIAAGFAFIYSGFYNVSATSKDNPLVAWMLHRTYEASLHHYGGKDSPPADLTSLENIRAGARLYDSSCALCHGAPGRQLSAVGQGIEPAAPLLLGATRRNKPPLMFWVIKHGVNMTAMPAFGNTQSDEALWQVAAFLYKGRGISKDQYDALKGAN